MVFVDGENLAIRFRAVLGDQTPPAHVLQDPDVWVWSQYLNIPATYVEVIRKHYYTSVSQDEPGAAQSKLHSRQQESRPRGYSQTQREAGEAGRCIAHH
jgi:hypothetical protein